MENCTIIIFGITGDLSKRKIIPAIYNLFKKNKFNKLAVIGVAQEKTNIEEIFKNAKEFIKEYDENIFNSLLSFSSYCQLDITNLAEFQKLKELILSEEEKLKINNRLFYCAVPSDLFIEITKNLSKSQIIEKNESESNGWQRIVYEKPFGYNLESAKKINNEIHKFVNESQIFRVDHYLAKEIVDNITYVRFTNLIFESLWNKNYIDSVQIILDEKVDIENRGPYYDKYGAIKDVIQNHMLQLVALVAMEPPKLLTKDFIRDSKADILKKIIPIDGFVGQYVDYQKESEVSTNSNTETFAVIKLLIDDPKWQNVPFYLKTGKVLEKKSTKIVIKFKHSICLLIKCPIPSNYLTIQIYPKEGVIIEINTKKPFDQDEIIKAEMEFCYSCLFEPEAAEAYESILIDVIKGIKTISVRQDEIEYSWAVTDKILNMNLPLFKYKKYSNGPKELIEFAQKNNFEWK